MTFPCEQKKEREEIDGDTTRGDLGATWKEEKERRR